MEKEESNCGGCIWFSAGKCQCSMSELYKCNCDPEEDVCKDFVAKEN